MTFVPAPRAASSQASRDRGIGSPLRHPLPFAWALLASLLCAAPASAGQEVELEVEAATLGSRGLHLVLDVRVRNPSAAEVYVLLSESLVFGAEHVERSCPADSPVLSGAPSLQLRSEEGDADAPACALEPRPPGPEWRRGILRLEAGQEVGLLVALGGPVPLEQLDRVVFGLSWATADELPRRLARRAYGADGVFLSARVVTGPPGGGRRAARLFGHRSTSVGVSVHHRAGSSE